MRGGVEVLLPPDREGRRQHTFRAVYGERLAQITRWYPGLPDPRTLTLDEIDFFYDALIPDLKRASGKA